MTTLAAAQTSPDTRVDHTALRVNQACIITIALLAFLFDAPWLAALLCLALVVGTLAPALAPFKSLYLHVLKPAGLLKPDVKRDSPAPHQFAQGMGGGVLALSIIAFALGAAPVGWALVILVAILAAVNLFAGFCAGCFVYYQLGRRGLLPGVTHA